MEHPASRTTSPTRGLHVGRRLRFVYLNNPKVACSTIKLALMRAETGDFSFEPATNVHDPKASPLASAADLGEDLAQVLADSFVFSFVRNPYRRLYSAFLNKILAGQKNGHFRKLAGFPADARPAFEAFVEHVAQQRYRDGNPHWWPQSRNLHAGTIAPTFVGKLERFEEDWKRVAEGIGAAPPVEFKGQRTRASSEDLKDVYTPRMSAIVVEAYAEDFERYGYPTDLAAA